MTTINITSYVKITQEQIQDPVSFATFFLEWIKQQPGKKIGFVGQPQAGATVSMHYLELIPNLTTIYDPRGIPDTINGTLECFSDLKEIVGEKLSNWMTLLEGAPYTNEELVAKFPVDPTVNDLLAWKDAFAILCLRDHTILAGEQPLYIYDLPSLPIEYNQFFDKLALIKRRDDWTNDPAFLDHIDKENVSVEAERGLVVVRDAQFEASKTAGKWVFDYEFTNDGDFDALEEKLIAMIDSLRGDLNV